MDRYEEWGFVPQAYVVRNDQLRIDSRFRQIFIKQKASTDHYVHINVKGSVACSVIIFISDDCGWNKSALSWDDSVHITV